MIWAIGVVIEAKGTEGTKRKLKLNAVRCADCWRWLVRPADAPADQAGSVWMAMTSPGSHSTWTVMGRQQT